MKRTKILPAVLVSFCVILYAQTKPAPSPVLARIVPESEQQYLSTRDAFYVTLNRARVPGGVVTILDCQEEPKQNWNLGGQRLDRALNEIVNANQNYRWEIENGAVNLLPSGNEPALLQIHIGEFVITTNSSLEALTGLQQRAELRDAMTNLGLSGGLTIVNYWARSKQFSIQFKGGTLRQALNAIAVANGTDIWDYKEIHCRSRNEVIIKF